MKIMRMLDHLENVIGRLARLCRLVAEKPTLQVIRFPDVEGATLSIKKRVDTGFLRKLFEKLVAEPNFQGIVETEGDICHEAWTLAPFGAFLGIEEPARRSARRMRTAHGGQGLEAQGDLV